MREEKCSYVVKCVKNIGVKCKNIKVGGFTVEFWTVWPLIEKKRVKIKTMLHAYIKQNWSGVQTDTHLYATLN